VLAFPHEMGRDTHGDRRLHDFFWLLFWKKAREPSRR
jgi:hypothetical protein